MSSKKNSIPVLTKDSPVLTRVRKAEIELDGDKLILCYKPVAPARVISMMETEDNAERVRLTITIASECIVNEDGTRMFNEEEAGQLPLDLLNTAIKLATGQGDLDVNPSIVPTEVD